MRGLSIVATLLLSGSAAEAPFDVAAEVEKGAKAYNARDMRRCCFPAGTLLAMGAAALAVGARAFRAG